MRSICEAAERQFDPQDPRSRRPAEIHRTDQAIAMAAMTMANRIGARAIIALTESGATAQWLSRFRSRIPIYAWPKAWANSDAQGKVPRQSRGAPGQIKGGAAYARRDMARPLPNAESSGPARPGQPGYNRPPFPPSSVSRGVRRIPRSKQ
jgi:hypothetical protein